MTPAELQAWREANHIHPQIGVHPTAKGLCRVCHEIQPRAFGAVADGAAQGSAQDTCPICLTRAIS
jgi:hypothetical protein